MTNISFVISTSGTKDNILNQIIDSIEIQNIPNYKIIIVGGATTTINRKNIIHIPFNENIPKAWITKKKNLGVQASPYENLVIMHDYFVFDPDWYQEFIKFGTDWDICIQQTLSLPEYGSVRCNGWRAGPIPGYPEIPFAMTIPWDIDCFVPYMGIFGGFWVAKKSVMLEQPLNENLYYGEEEDLEWSSRVVPGWQGRKSQGKNYRIVANPNCITRLNKFKHPYPGNPNFEAMSQSLNWLWDKIRQGYRRPNVWHWESSVGDVVLSK